MLMHRCRLPQRLSTQAEALNERTVAGDVGLAQVGKHATTATNQGHQATAGVVVVLVSLQVLGQVEDAPRKHSNLNLGGTGVPFGTSEFPNDFLLDSGIEC